MESQESLTKGFPFNTENPPEKSFSDDPLKNATSSTGNRISGLRIISGLPEFVNRGSGPLRFNGFSGLTATGYQVTVHRLQGSPEIAPQPPDFDSGRRSWRIRSSSRRISMGYGFSPGSLSALQSLSQFLPISLALSLFHLSVSSLCLPLNLPESLSLGLPVKPSLRSLF
jgi:hypothetical protein